MCICDFFVPLRRKIGQIFGLHDDDYICLTDMVKAEDNNERTNIVIQNWMRRKDTISYLGVWENLHNPHFNCIEFDAIKSASGTNRFILTAKEWIERTRKLFSKKYTHAGNIKTTCGGSGGNGGNFSAIPPQASLPPCCVIKNEALIFREKTLRNGFLRTFYYYL